MTSEASVTRRRHMAQWGAFEAVVENGRFVAAEPFAGDPEPSDILQAMPESVYHRSRIDRPHVRQGFLERGPDSRAGRGADPYVPVSWERALDLVASELARVKAAHGNEAIFAGSYGWASAGQLHHSKTVLQRFMGFHGGYVGQMGSYSVAAALAIVPHVTGEATPTAGPITSWESIIAKCGLFVAFGGLPMRNDQVGTRGVGEHRLGGYLARARAAGCRFINVSPVRADMSETIEPEWLAIRPNTDTALMLGLAHTLASEGLADRDFLASHCHGYDRFAAYLLGLTDGQPKDAEWAAALTGIEAAAIHDLARRMAATRCMVTASWSLQRGDHGEQPFWMLITLAAMLGQIGLPGGGFGLGYGSIAGMGAIRRPVGLPTLPRPENQVRNSIPVARIADMLLDPGGAYDFNGAERRYPDIRLVYWCGGNPFHHHQDLNRLVEAWRRPETIVVHEPWWTATARHADIVLPATTSLERNDVGGGQRDRYLFAMQQAIEPVGEARNDFDIFAGLAERLGFAEAYDEGRDEMGWIEHLYEVTRQQAAGAGVSWPDFETFWRTGHAESPEAETPHVLFAAFRADPEAHPLRTPSGKLEIHSPTIEGFGYDDCPGMPTWLAPMEWLGAAAAARHPLHMLSSQPGGRLHSQLDQCAVSRAGKVADREPIVLNRADAAARGIAEGDIVRVFNDRGQVLAGAVLSDAIRAGVVQLSTGAWYDPATPGEIGSLDKHGNANVLTLDKGTSRLAQGPSAHSALVDIERFTGEPPAVTAFDPPPAAAAE